MSLEERENKEMAEKSKTAAIINDLMLRTTKKQVAQAALTAIDSIQADRVENQILGIAAILICLLDQYGLSHVDVLGIADNMVYSGNNNNMIPDFKAIKNYMKSEWEI